jgi:intracellular sulfur oxidation DsrE/DsrF family protein
MNKKNRLTLAVFFLLCSAPFLAVAQAAPPPDSGLKDTEALRDLKLAKGVFMLDVKDPNRMAHVLKVIEETREGIARQDVKPELVVVVVGPSVAFLTKDRRGISYLDERAVSEIQGAIVKLKGMGVRTEACGVALKGMDVRPDALIPEVTPVGNGYISAIGYQMQGYQLVPVY